MAKIKVKDKESIDEALRRFKRECEKCGIIQEVKKREHYESPSVTKKKKIQELKRKFKRKLQKAQIKAMRKRR
ncbi:MAG: 30S ribosomal protein S21 [bacterium]|nr:30S ribosomal protein S21 [bacterium]